MSNPPSLIILGYDRPEVATWIKYMVLALIFMMAFFSELWAFSAQWVPVKHNSKGQFITLFSFQQNELMKLAQLVNDIEKKCDEQNITSRLVSLTPSELKYRLREKFGDKIAWCGPHIGSMSINSAALSNQFSEVMTNPEEFRTILRQNHLSNIGPWSDQDKRIVIREHRLLSTIFLEPRDNTYRFRIRVDKSQMDAMPPPTTDRRSPYLPTNAFLIEGTINKNGKINILDKKPIHYECPQ